MDPLPTVARTIAAQLVRPQLDFIADPARWKVACCSKQCGKNFCVARLMLLVALDRPRVQVAYVNATYGEAKNIMWRDPNDGLPAVLENLGLKERRDYTLNGSELTVTLSNGSLIRLFGADREGWRRLLGQKYALIVGDELQKMEDEGLRYALTNIIPDRLTAEGGQFVGIGTPEQFAVGVWWEVTTRQSDPETGEPLHPAYSVHHWTAEALDGVTPVWREQLEYKRLHRIPDDDPAWLRDKLGLWATDSETFMHDIDGMRATWDGTLPPTVVCSDGVTWLPRTLPVVSYGAVDFGFTDSTALVVGSVSREEGILRELHSEKAPGLNTQQLALRMGEVQRQTGCRTWYGDNAAAQSIADLNQLYGLDVRPCEKGDRNLWHGEMDSAFRAHECLIRSGSPLHVELKTLTRCPAALARRSIEPPPGSEDHCYDSWRYLFRAVRTHHVRQPERPLTPDEARMRAVDDRMRRMTTPRAPGSALDRRRPPATDVRRRTR